MGLNKANVVYTVYIVTSTDLTWSHTDQALVRLSQEHHKWMNSFGWV